MRKYRSPRAETASNAHPLVKVMSKEMKRQRVALRDVADRAGLPYKTVSNWRAGLREPKLGDIDAVFNVLGYRLKVEAADWRDRDMALEADS